jgi:hypothetical protein
VRRVCIIVFNNLGNLALVQLICLQFCINLNISFITVVLLSTDDKGDVKTSKLGQCRTTKSCASMSTFLDGVEKLGVVQLETGSDTVAQPMIKSFAIG